MNQNIIYIIAAFILSAACGFFIIPQIIKFCRKKGLYDPPGGRKIHRNNIPRLGGISFVPSMLVAALIVVLVHNEDYTSQKIVLSSWSITFFISLLLVYCVGIIDDLVGLGARTKFSVQTIAALLLPLSGLYINNLYGFCGIYDIPFVIGLPLTVFVIIFSCNAINLIDGIDGLSGSITFIALTGFLLCFLSEDLYSYCILISGLMGVLVAFLYFNIWGSEKSNHKIFMGDSGSLTLGFILGFLLVKYTMLDKEAMPFQPNAMLVAYSLLVVPTFDVVRVALARIVHRKHIFRADKNHIHHKLMRTGLTQHQALSTILVMALAFIALNLLLNKVTNLTYIVAIDIVVWIVIHLFTDRTLVKRGMPVFLEN
jgi:UDP-N-acetylmuramyl pentapeptide phosphotransferase/UDP-N-acetylglucosamine-1-phosphate transferase